MGWSNFRFLTIGLAIFSVLVVQGWKWAHATSGFSFRDEPEVNLPPVESARPVGVLNLFPLLASKEFQQEPKRWNDLTVAELRQRVALHRERLR